jgi:hypothetical protein
MNELCVVMSYMKLSPYEFGRNIWVGSVSQDTVLELSVAGLVIMCTWIVWNMEMMKM